MPYTPQRRTEPCTVCGSEANIHAREFSIGEIVDCARCGDFQISHTTARVIGLPYTDPKERALASYNIRKMQLSDQRCNLTRDFFESLRDKSLPTPAEASDNLIVWLATQMDGRPGNMVDFAFADPLVLGNAGVVEASGVKWIVSNLESQGVLRSRSNGITCTADLTAAGWQRFEDLKRAHVSSKFAFFARKFSNVDLDKVFETCLRPAVWQTGYELRLATQRAGLVDAIIEDEIRRCRFLIADLSDDNAGAYWEAGFAEGLGKPVIYICRATADGAVKETHFDANHRHTVRWDLSSLDQTAKELKAVIRNTLLGDAKQSD